MSWQSFQLRPSLEDANCFQLVDADIPLGVSDPPAFQECATLVELGEFEKAVYNALQN